MTDAFRAELAPGYSISRVINGCWQLSPGHGGGPGSSARALDMFAELVDHGFTTFDCADIYTGVEELLGRFLKTRSDRDSIQVHTKLVPDRAALPALKAADVDAAVDRSLRRLGVERLDLVQFHWWDYAVPGLELLAGRLQAAQQAGKVRLLGATNFDTGHVCRLVESGVPLVSLQAQYSLLDRRPEKRMVPQAARTGVSLLPYGVLAGGFLTRRYLGAPPPGATNRSLAKYRLVIEEAGGWKGFQQLLALLTDIGARHGVGPELVAARWVLDRPGVAAIVLGVGSRSRASHNLALARLRLDEADLAGIQSVLAGLPVPPGDMYDLERDASGPHARIIKTDLNADPGAVDGVT